MSDRPARSETGGVVDSSSRPRVSIVTPAREAAPFLPEAYESIRRQTFGDWEWIVVDDASEDGTWELLQGWAASDPRVRPLRRSRSDGLAAAVRNVGLAAARGELVALLDADDLWHSEKLELQVRYLDQRPAVGGVCTWYDSFGWAPGVRADLRVQRPEAVIERRDFLRGSEVKTPSLVFRRSLLETVGGFDEDPRLVTGEDEEFFFRLARAGSLHRIRRVLTHVRRRPPGESLTGRELHAGVAKKLHLAQIYFEKGLIGSAERRVVRSNAFYQQAADNLFKHRAPFRLPLLRSIAAGRPPLRAVLILAVSWLPARWLRPLLAAGQRWLMVRGERRGDPADPASTGGSL